MTKLSNWRESHGSEDRAEVIRQSNEYQELTAEEKRAVEAGPIYMRADYILQLLAERKGKK